jgi:hypothetical protein
MYSLFRVLKFEHLLARVAHFAQDSRYLLFLSRSADGVVHGRRSAHENDQILARRGRRQVSFAYLSVNEPGFSLPGGILDFEFAGQDVNDLETVGVLLGPLVDHLTSQNVLGVLGSVQHNDLLIGGFVAQNGVQGLNHGGDSGSAHHHDDFLWLERRLNLDVRANVLEFDGIADRHFVKVTRHARLCAVVLDEQIKASRHGIRRDRSVGTHHIFHGPFRGLAVGLGEDASAGRQIHGLGSVGQAKAKDGGSLRDFGSLQQGSRNKLIGELTLSGRNQSLDGLACETGRFGAHCG